MHRKIIIFISILLVAGCSNIENKKSAADVPEPPELVTRSECVAEVYAFSRTQTRTWQESKRLIRVLKQPGWVLLGYDLDGTGEAKNIRILQAEPTTLHNRRSIKDLKEIKYRQGEQAEDCMYLFRFELIEA
jgi:hypothetical protein